MTKVIRILLPLLLFVAAGIAATFPIFAETEPTCSEISVPAELSESGCYLLSNDIQVSGAGAAIIVTAGAVSIDLGGHTIAVSDPESSSPGVLITGSDIVKVANGQIDGFLFGVRSSKAGEVIIDNVGVSGGARGFFIEANSASIRNSTVSDMAGYSGWPSSHTIGIEVFASRCRIEDNEVRDIYPFSTGEIVGISVSRPADDCNILNNSITNADKPGVVGRGIAFWLTGDQASNPEGVVVSENSISGYDYAFMAQPPAREAFTQNSFSVSCLPADVATYDGAEAANDFTPFGDTCRDSIPYLRDKALASDPMWAIRLAAALLEGQAPTSPDERCANLLEAEAIIEPLLDMPEAKAQLPRVEQRLQSCD